MYGKGATDVCTFTVITVVQLPLRADEVVDGTKKQNTV